MNKLAQWGAIFLKEHSYFYAPTISLNDYEALITLLDQNLKNSFVNIKIIFQKIPSQIG